MAKRAIERLDAELEKTLYVPIDRAEARRILTAIEALRAKTTEIPPEFAVLHDTLTAALEELRENPAL